jgi:hypothetical protein
MDEEAELDLNKEDEVSYVCSPFKMVCSTS